MLEVDGMSVPVYMLNTLVVGSGAAGLNCAVRLFRELEECGVENLAEQVAVLTHGIGTGTSHNSGSDKQTYYKMGLDAVEGDAAVEFARTLTAAGCAHGDLALIEAVNSLRSFFHLADAGVPFPHNERGVFVGYKTDHDPSQRATSAGPWTSRFMVLKLLGELKRYDVPILGGYHMLAVITTGEGNDRRACGALCVDIAAQGGENHGLTLFNCRNLVVAGGGPGELYEISVYPKGQMGPYAALLEAGAKAQNLTELQFGLASLQPRWNLSGTYQQVIPRYYSTDPEGGNVQEFLNPWFDSMGEMATNIFLKGYQWPFDPQKLPGSSLIDVIVQQEMVGRGRRVFMDFTRNPVPTGDMEEFRLEDLGEEARTYLEKSGADQATPIERLAHMNQPSIDLYHEMGVNLWREPLEVGVCCQHCNGGFAVDVWWESDVDHLFVIGELAGTHGVKRPGGSALNAGQVGGLRAAQRIAHVYYGDPDPPVDFGDVAAPVVKRFERIVATIKKRPAGALDCAEVKRDIQSRMSARAGMVRSAEDLREALQRAEEQWGRIAGEGLVQPEDGYLKAVQARELALAQRAFLEAMLGLIERGEGSRGSHLVADPDGELPHPGLGDEWRFKPENEDLRDEILTLSYDPAEDAFGVEVVAPRPIPESEYWFENTWAEFRKGSLFRSKESDDPRPYDTYR
jgi:succinate dehydrogenase/fumarate reductase flavoprotein subunit